MKWVTDASALLAVAFGEPGKERVLEVLRTGTCLCGAANWSEVLQKAQQHGLDKFRLASLLLGGLGLQIIPVSIQDADRAAEIWRNHRYLSLADRLCLALADRMEATVLTADQTWGESQRIVQIR